jgi:FtsP/CotA-like multicopper oxidase with cupredoxin domain
MTHRELRNRLLLAAVVVGGTLTVTGATVAPATPPSFDLCAKAGDLAVPGGATVPVWGFAPGDCSNPAIPAQVPGPVLDYPQGTAVTVTLHNSLSRPVALDLPGLNVAEGPAVAAPDGGTATYHFTASAPGTYLYSSGLDGGRQVAMGLYGALVVRPAAVGRAYDEAFGPSDPRSTAYDREAVLVLSEIDPAFNADPLGFDMNDWHPTYWLINGKAHPDTADIPVQNGDRVLLRYVSAGAETVTMTMLGTRSRLVARDASTLSNPYEVVAETIPAGSTADEITTIPASGTAFPLYNRQLHLTNGAFGSPQHAPGGMLAFMRVP